MLQSVGSQRVRHNLAIEQQEVMFKYIFLERKKEIKESLRYTLSFQKALRTVLDLMNILFRC